MASMTKEVILGAGQARLVGAHLQANMHEEGSSCATGFDQDGDLIEWPIHLAESGWYRLSIRQASLGGAKRNRIEVDDQAYGDLISPDREGFFDLEVGMLRLSEGGHRIAVCKVWGGIAIERLRLVAVPAPNRETPRFDLVNPEASGASRRLMAYLSQVYGRGIISGQHTSAADGPEMTAIRQLTGKSPALRGFDLLSYSQGAHIQDMSEEAKSEVDRNRGSVEAAIRWWQETHGIVAICWHWFSPLGGRDKSFYTRDTSFDLSRALVPDTKEHLALMADIDAIAEALGKLQEAGVPVLWRPLHEADGAWFWWGAKGPEAYLRLYRLLYQRLTHHHHLNHLIWVWNAPDPAWYPGSDYVDIVGDDIYVAKGNYGPLKFAYDRARALAGNEKPVALTENGAIPDPTSLQASGAGWLWFMPWWGGGATYGESNSEDHVIAVYDHPYVITLEDLPDLTKADN